MEREEMRAEGEAVARRLGVVRRRVRFELLFEGIAWLLGVGVALAAASLLFDWLLRFGLTTRWSLAVLAGASVLVVIHRFLLRPLRVRLSAMDLALLLDRRRPGTIQQVANVLELPRLLDEDPSASPAMVRVAVAENASALRGSDFVALLDQRRWRRFAALMVAVLVLPAAFAAVAPSTAGLWARRWLFGSDERWPQRTYLSIVGLDDANFLHAPRGEPLVLQVDAMPPFQPHGDGWELTGRGEPFLLPTGDAPSSVVPEVIHLRYRSEGLDQQRAVLTHYQDSLFRFEFPPIQRPISLSLTGGDDWLGPVSIVPIDRPQVESWSLKVVPPGGSDGDARTYTEADGSLLFRRNATLELRMTASTPLRSVELTSASGMAPALEPVGDRDYVARWNMREHLGLEFHLVDAEHGLASKPYFLTIGLLEDRVPRVAIRVSGVGRRVTPQATLPLSIRALDDFGMVAVVVMTEETRPSPTGPKQSARRAELELASAEPAAEPVLEFQQQVRDELTERKYPPGTILRVRCEATDNCSEGAQTGQSRWLVFQVVNPDELFYEILTRLRGQRRRFEAALKLAEEQSKGLAGELDGPAVSGLIRRHQVVARQVWAVAGRVEESLQEMRLNALGSPQALDLLQSSIIDPMRLLHDERMGEQRRKLLAMAAGVIGERLPEARGAQQEIVEEMQQLLARMAQWESFVDVINQLREVIRMEEGVLDATEQFRTDREEGLFDD